MKRHLFLLMLFLAPTAYAQLEVRFDSATVAYNNGDYEKAISYYMEILDEGQHSAALYYNLGNSHYKLNQIAPSIYYYEKALLLAPNDQEIRNNLVYAQNMTLDAISPLPETTLSRFYKQVTGILSFDGWSYLAVVFVLAFVLSYILFYYLRSSTHKRIAFISSLIAITLTVISVVIAFLRYQDFMEDQPAIIFDEEVNVKAEPNERSEIAFTLHEGTKVNVLEEFDAWKKIELSDGQTGWMLSESLKELKDF
ncbi:tetratricopeptide repeat protein [Lentiprolixibacter aurantiacus]|uniref:Tetratricopeptide repeat protein n=1 Tax=Lentiprolixibacter aurantiacus TaxID=2993939 RepID=A0AAE3MJI3_9FLAO|nr:tetratricopeptide repeat protein [Lentiprolixibacter aurantiacus]MCX2718373.1 tetratricopeptide repeat protein [Lentiprolixibacter aurantiacus]